MGAPKGHPPYPGCEKGGVSKVYTDEFIEKEADAFLEWMKQGKGIFYKRFALSRGYSPQRMCEWAKSNKKFAEVYEFCKHWQESEFLEKSLLGEYNNSIARLALATHHGYTEKSQISGDQANPLMAVINLVDGKTKELVNDESE